MINLLCVSFSVRQGINFIYKQLCHSQLPQQSLIPQFLVSNSLEKVLHCRVCDILLALCVINISFIIFSPLWYLLTFYSMGVGGWRSVNFSLGTLKDETFLFEWFALSMLLLFQSINSIFLSILYLHSWYNNSISFHPICILSPTSITE